MTKPNALAASLFLTSALASAQIETVQISINDGVGEDTFVHSRLDAQNVNYNTISSMNVYGWTNAGNVGVKRAFLLFDLSVIPEDAVITGARLSLFYNPDDDAESTDVHSGENAWVVQRVSAAWEPAVITWNDQPGVSNVNAVNMPTTISGTQDFVDIDVTGLVQDMLTTGQHGFRLSLQTELPYRMLILASAEDSDPARRPLLEVDYQSGVGVREAGSALQEFTTLWQGTNALLVRSSRQHSAATIDVMDTGGRVVLSVPLNGSSTLMNTTNWLPGVYLIALRDGDSQSIRRVVKED